MPDAVDALSVSPRPARGAIRARVQRHGLQPLGRGGAVTASSDLPRRRDHVRRGREAPGHRRHVARRRGRLGRPAGLGFRTAVRHRQRVRRLPVPNDRRTIPRVNQSPNGKLRQRFFPCPGPRTPMMAVRRGCLLFRGPPEMTVPGTGIVRSRNGQLTDFSLT